jgi:hypothetical protein
VTAQAAFSKIGRISTYFRKDSFLNTSGTKQKYKTKNHKLKVIGILILQTMKQIIIFGETIPLEMNREMNKTLSIAPCVGLLFLPKTAG